MSRYTVTPGAVDQFNQVCTWVVWLDEKTPFAICKSKEDADQVSAVLNAADPVEEEPAPVPPDTDWNLCPRGGDHAYNLDAICKKCGHDGIPF
jgi:hypothetical protein